MNKFAYLVLAFMAFLAVSCSKSTEIYPSATIEDFAPMQIGKYITYRLDSTVTTNFGVAFEVHTYEVKFLVDAQITDNLGRPAYRIFRYIRNNPGQAWLPDNTFTATNTGTSSPRPEYVAAIRYPDGRRDLFHIDTSTAPRT